MQLQINMMIHLGFPESWTWWKNVLEIYSKYLMTFMTKYIINKTSLLCRVNMSQYGSIRLRIELLSHKKKEKKELILMIDWRIESDSIIF